MDYKKILEGVVDIINTTEKSDIGFTNICAYIGENCPELKESGDERIMKELICFLETEIPQCNARDKYIAWLEKQSKASKVEQALREVEEKADAFTEAHKGETSDEILAQMRGEQKPDKWTEEDEKKRKGLIKGLEDRMGFGWACDSFSREEYIDWLKSLRPQSTWKPSERQLECLGYAIDKAEKDWSPLINNRIYLTLKALKEQLMKLKG